MNLSGFPLLSLILWLPALGALMLALLPRERESLYRSTALLTTLATLLLALLAATAVAGAAPPVLDPAATGDVVLQLVERVAWIPSWGSDYLLGVDGVNLWLVVLTTFLAPLAIGATWGRSHPQLRTMLALLLAFESTLLGVFLAQDMLLFYVFYEAALLPAVFLVGIWGGPTRQAAALKLFLYTFASSVFMLLGIIGLYALHRAALGATTPGYSGTFELAQIIADMRSGAFGLPETMQRLLFGAFFAAFAVKTALWPFHTWLPGAYGAAPTAVAVLLAGVMSKMGVYGMLRFSLPLFPEAARWAAPAIGLLAVIGIIYGAMVAFSQTDMQRLIAYSSISHMNMVVLGIFALNAIGISGAIFQMASHGLTTAAMLLVVGVLDERRGSREISAFSGLWRSMPVYGSLAFVAVLALIGLPGLSGFIGELTMMQGVFSSPVLGWPYALGAAVGVILAAVYGLRMFRLVFMGESHSAAMPDLARREQLTLGLLLAVIIVLGLYPNLLLAPLQGTLSGLFAYVNLMAG